MVTHLLHPKKKGRSSHSYSNGMTMLTMLAIHVDKAEKAKLQKTAAFTCRNKPNPN